MIERLNCSRSNSRSDAEVSIIRWISCWYRNSNASLSRIASSASALARVIRMRFFHAWKKCKKLAAACFWSFWAWTARFHLRKQFYNGKNKLALWYATWKVVRTWHGWSFCRALMAIETATPQLTIVQHRRNKVRSAAPTCNRAPRIADVQRSLR